MSKLEVKYFTSDQRKATGYDWLVMPASAMWVIGSLSSDNFKTKKLLGQVTFKVSTKKMQEVL